MYFVGTKNNNNNNAALCIPNLFSGIKKEGAERVVVAAVVAEETPGGHVGGHLVPRRQVEDQDRGGAVLLVLLVVFSVSRHRLPVDQQVGADGQDVARGTGVAVGGEGHAVDAGVRNGEDPGVHAVAAAQVDEDVLIGDELVGGEGAEADQIVVSGERDGEGAAARWKTKEISFVQRNV